MNAEQLDAVLRILTRMRANSKHLVDGSGRAAMLAEIDEVDVIAMEELRVSGALDRLREAVLACDPASDTFKKMTHQLQELAQEPYEGTVVLLTRNLYEGLLDFVQQVLESLDVQSIPLSTSPREVPGESGDGCQS